MTHPCIHVYRGLGWEVHYGQREDGMYVLLQQIKWWSQRYKKWITVELGFPSDGATGAPDIMSRAPWIHDKICKTKKWDDGTPCTHWQRSMVIGDVLAEEGRYVRRWTWPLATWLAGVCGMG